MLSANFTKTAVLIEQKNFPFTMPVDWQSPKSHVNLSASLQDWLLHTGSLTERLQALTSSFEVKLLGQKVMDIDDSEQHLLANNSKHFSQTWQVREVVLQGNQQDWVFARSVLPNELCNSKWANLGTQPLGQRIFNDPSFVRSDFEIGLLKFHPLTGQVFSSTSPCWARRSKFTIEDYELIVAEAFLPKAPCYK